MPEGATIQADASPTLVVPARVSLLAGARATADELVQLARKAAPDPSIFDEREPFYWSAEISSNRLDAYFTTMAKSTLQNFAADAEAGIAFMNSHRTGGFIGDAELPLGRSLAGRFVGAGGNGVMKTLADFYTLRGLALNGSSGPTTDQFLDGMRSGVISDVSVGFYGGEVRCSICNRDMWRDWECRHYPGRDYAVVDESGTPTGDRVVAIGVIENAHLAEVSAVYDGACPGAKIVSLKATADIAEGRMPPDLALSLEQQFRIRLPSPARLFPGADVPTERTEVTMPTDPTDGGQTPTFDLAAQLRAALTDAGVTVGESDEALALAVRSSLDDLKRLRPLETEVAGLRTLADEGRKYRADEIARAILEGKRALGEAFAEATYQPLLEAAPLETVQRMAADWKAIGDKQFPGGRLSQDTADEPTPIGGRRRNVPASARG